MTDGIAQAMSAGCQSPLAPSDEGGGSYGGIAAEIAAKNMPPACFLHAATEGLSPTTPSNPTTLPPQICAKRRTHQKFLKKRDFSSHHAIIKHVSNGPWAVAVSISN